MNEPNALNERNDLNGFLMKIRIAHIITTLELGGAQKHALSLVSRLSPERYEAHLLCGDEGRLHSQAQQSPNLRFRRIPFLRRRLAPVQDILALIYLTAIFANTAFSWSIRIAPKPAFSAAGRRFLPACP